MKAVVRVITRDSAKWRVLQSTPPMDERDVLKLATEFAEAHRFDPLVCDSIINLPVLPLERMHSWWNRPDRVLDVRPVEPVEAIRFYRLTATAQVVHFDQRLHIREHDPVLDAPLGMSDRLFPYGTETFFTQR